MIQKKNESKIVIIKNRKFKFRNSNLSSNYTINKNNEFTFINSTKKNNENSFSK